VGKKGAENAAGLRKEDRRRRRREGEDRR